MRSNIFIKVVIEHEPGEKPEKVAAELCRQLTKNFMVRRAEVSNVSNEDDH